MQKVLIVEDDVDLVETYTDLLEMHHYSVTSTARAVDAISLVTRIKPNIVLLDLNLAGRSGTIVINMIKSYMPLKDTKIVVVTGYPEILDGNRDALRVDLILSKPVSNERLLETVNRFAPLYYPKAATMSVSETATFIELLRKMGHDMRVPLNTLSSTSDMLVQGIYDPLTPKQAKATTRLQRNSYRLLAILDDFVTYVKVEAGELTLNPKPFDPRVQLEGWCSSVRPAIEEKGLQLQVVTAEKVPASFNGDETLIGRIVLALLWNAASFTAQGEIRVMSDWTPEQEWQISIQDTGSGITESDVPHIFEPFWRGEERPQVPTAGAGLGLPVALALAKRLGGNLSLKETSPKGSIFCVTLKEK